MRRGSNRNARLPEMGNNRELSLLRQIADALGFGESAHAANVGLDHADFSSIHQIEKLIARSQPLSRGNRNGLFGSQTREIILPSGRRLVSNPLADIANLPPADYFFLHYAFLTKGHVADRPLDDYVRLNREIAETTEDAARRVGAKGFFLPSSGAVYGPGRVLRGSLQDNPYGFLKLKDEERFAAMAEQLGCAACLIRVFNLAGPCMNNLDGYALSSVIVSVLRGEPVRLRADKPVLRSYVHIIDLVAFALLEMMDGARTPILDTAGEVVVEVGLLARQITSLMGRPDYPIERPPLTGTEDRYVGDGTAFRARAQAQGLGLRGLEDQIRDTVADLTIRASKS